MLEEIKNFREALSRKQISYDTWFFFDLDNTVMESRLELGGDQWFSAMLQYAKEIFPENKQLAFETVIVIYHELQAHVRTQAVEKEIVGIINAIQDIGIPVFAITARDETIGPSTERQLKDIGIDFSRNIPNEIAGIHQGIIYCSGKNKGDHLKAFFNKLTYLPAHIVGFDDKGSHLEDELKTCQLSNVRFNGWRYGFLDEKIKTFDITIANQQLAHIKHRLPTHVQIAIDKLKLIPEEVTLSPAQYSHGFFREIPSPTSSVFSNPDPIRATLRRHQSDTVIRYFQDQDITTPSI